jgi:ferric-dicitrate binding protein FerR (iron transport regulator)
MKPETECARYQALVEQELLEEGAPNTEERLNDEERQLLSSHPRHCDACAPEAALWTRLGQVREERAAQLSAPPTSGSSVERVLGRAQERRSSLRRQRLAWVVAPAAAAAMLLSVLFVMQRQSATSSPTSPSTSPPPRATVRPLVAHLGLVSGTVRVTGAQAMAGRRLLPGEALSTANGTAVVTFSDASRVFVEPHTTVVLRTTERARVRLHLQRGAATFQVVPHPTELPSGAPFEVEAGWARVQVLGTLFQVATHPAKERVAVARGRVRVIRKSGATEILSAGQQLIGHGSPHALTSAGREHLLRRLTLASLLPAHAGGVLVVRTTPATASLRLNGRHLGATPLSVRVVPGDYALSLSLPGFSPHNEDLHVGHTDRVDLHRTLRPQLGPVSVGSTPTRPHRLTPGVKRNHAPTVTAPTVTVATLLQKIRAQRAQSNWLGAVRGYQTLRRLHPRAAEAHTCLVLMGQVQLRHLGQAKAALRSFDRYLRQGGSLAPEAAWGRIQALSKLRRPTAEQKACRVFLIRYPRSLYAPQVKKRLRSPSDH